MELGKITKRILSRLPYWFKMRHDPKSIGAQFLNCFGLEMQDAEDILNYAFEQCYLKTVDVNQADICYKGYLPISIKEDMILNFSSRDVKLWPSPDLKHFFYGFARSNDTPALVQQNPYYIDWTTRVIYVRHPYLKDGDHPEGKITVEVVIDGQRVSTAVIQLHMHMVWNALDEIGMLLATPRIYGEDNHYYLERLISVFRFPGGAHTAGMVNAITRGLCLTRRIYWADKAIDLPLNHAHILLDTLSIDDEKAPPELYTMDEDYRVILKGDPSKKGESAWIFYAYGVELHQLFDEDIYATLFTVDGDASVKLLHYTEQIQQLVHLDWGDFVWGQDGWSEINTSTACLPVFFDAATIGWESYE